MTPAETTAILRQFNEWLNGNENGPQLESRMIRKAIGDVPQCARSCPTSNCCSF